MTETSASHRNDRPQKLAFFGGSFDPVHLGHLSTARRLVETFRFDEFLFVPASHAPHKRRSAPTPAIDRYAMLCLATEAEPLMKVSRMEIDQPDRPYTFQTLTRLKESYPTDEIYFVMGADSWADITSWYEWEKVLELTNHIVMTRPGYEIETGHVTKVIRGRIADVRASAALESSVPDGNRIYFSDAVNLDISASSVRRRAAEDDRSWRQDVPENVANYIEKYQIYK